MRKTIDRSRMDRAAAFTQVADAVLATEDASDAALAAAGALLSKAAGSRAATGVPVMVAQRVLDDLEKMVATQFESRRALLAAHSRLTAIVKVAERADDDGGVYPWGPDSPCPQSTKAMADAAPAVELRAVS